MKINLPVTTTEKTLSANHSLISITNLKGIITSVNDDFIQISGFTEDELVGKNHNIVRHPDMPPEAFADLWQTLKEGKSWMGLVKNRCKNGDYYWVDAYVSPVYEKNTIVGYQSVRTKPDRKHVDLANTLYKEIKQKHQPKFRIADIGVTLRGFVGILSLITLMLGSLYGIGEISLGAMLVSWFSSAVLGYAVARVVTQPLINAANDTKKLVDNGLLQKAYFGGANEITQMLLANKFLHAKINTMRGRVSQYAEQLELSAEKNAATAEQTNQGIKIHQSETDQVATAINEMTATVQEVARSAGQAATATHNANEQTLKGKSIVVDTSNAIQALANEVEKATEVIYKLGQESENIGSVVDVIRAITEQTNLLALNAAIEAARAGEQGRGFAVVADEVRTLASRTQQSTEEIHNMIAQLQSGTRHAVEVMEQGRNLAQNSVKQTALAGDALQTITDAVETITDMNAQIASAAEQQSAVADEINRNIANITDVIEHTADGAEQTFRSSEELTKLASQLKSLVMQSSI